MEFDAWFSEVRLGLAEETGGILALCQPVKDAYARGDTPSQFINQTLMAIEQDRDEYDELECEEE